MTSNEGRAGFPRSLAWLAASLFFAAPAHADSAERPQEPEKCHVYTVQPGDTLTGIAREYRKTLNEILAANPDIENPDRIRAGQKIAIPLQTHSQVSGENSPEPKENVVAEPVSAADKAYDILKSYLGAPYGPTYPQGPDKDMRHFDCVSLVYEFAKCWKESELTGSRGDEIYARHTDPVAVLTPEKKDLTGILTGDIVFVGHPYKLGEGGISVYHLGIVGIPVRDANGKIIDYTMVHASGSYGKNRATDYRGKVVEESLLGYLGKFSGDARRNHMFIGRLKDAQKKAQSEHAPKRQSGKGL